ncbi:MAG: LacI family transcriptional regulator [Bacteroidota bacterium]|nr:LacI family transcriptional regulator [Bacteroidota bacterium]
MFKAATIKDIAKELGFSASTVSRALLDSHEVSAETKKKVKEYAKKINYYSNPAARSLKNSRSYSVGVMVADVANSFFSQAINGIESIAYERGYHVIITQSHDLYTREAINIEHLANSSVDGLLISMSAGTTDYSHIIKLHEQGLPIVFFDRIIEDIKTFKVTSDNFKAAFDATGLLIDKGYKKIAFIANAPHLSITKDRVQGYKTALEANQLQFEEHLVKYCFAGGRILEEVHTSIEYLLALPEKPQAFFIASDQLSKASMRALHSASKNDHPAIIGFSNSDVIDLISPHISYIRQNAFKMGELAMEMLLKLIESKYPIYDFETKFVDAEVHWRDNF